MSGLTWQCFWHSLGVVYCWGCQVWLDSVFGTLLVRFTASDKVLSWCSLLLVIPGLTWQCFWHSLGVVYCWWCQIWLDCVLGSAWVWMTASGVRFDLTWTLFDLLIWPNLVWLDGFGWLGVENSHWCRVWLALTWLGSTWLVFSGTVWVCWTASGARFKRMDRRRSSLPTATPSVLALVVWLVPILPTVTRSVVSASYELWSFEGSLKKCLKSSRS